VQTLLTSPLVGYQGAVSSTAAAQVGHDVDVAAAIAPRAGGDSCFVVIAAPVGAHKMKSSDLQPNFPEGCCHRALKQPGLDPPWKMSLCLAMSA